MIANLRTWFDGRSRREKWLVLVMLGLSVVTLVWGLSRSIDETLSSARQRNTDAAVRLAQTRAQVEAVRTLRRIRPGNAAGPIEGIVRQSAGAASLTLGAVAPEGAKLHVHVNSARGGALLAWIGGLEGQGVLVDKLSITDSGNRTVAADITFRMAAL